LPQSSFYNYKYNCIYKFCGEILKIFYYLEEIDRFFFDVFGPEHRKDLEKQVEDKFQKMLADNPNVNFSDRIGMKMALRDALKNKKFEAMWKYQNDPAGWVARYINRVYISPIQLYEHIKSSDMFANLIASTIAHEIGHILGLERIDEEQDVERSNLMSTINQTATDDAKERIFKNKLVFNVNLTENQIRQINQHLKGE